MQVALITGITGQDGSYLAELLLNKGYIVHGLKRRSSSFNTARIDHIYQDPHFERRRFFLHYGDLTDSGNIISLVGNIRPNLIFHLGAQSHVKVSFESAEYTANTDAIGTLRILEAIRIHGLEKDIKFFQASTSEMFGNHKGPFQNESTPFKPCSPYGSAKLFAYWSVCNYRDAYGIFGSNGIMFNHESPRRGETFLSRKVTMAIPRLITGSQDVLYLGNLNAERDWGHAKDYMKAAWMILMHQHPDDFVISTGASHSVRTFVQMCFSYAGIEIQYHNKGNNEYAKVNKIDHERIRLLGFNDKPRINKNDIVVRIDPNYYRPNELHKLQGDSRKIQEELGWKPEFNIDELIAEMVESDIISYLKNE